MVRTQGRDTNDALWRGRSPAHTRSHSDITMKEAGSNLWPFAPSRWATFKKCTGWAEDLGWRQGWDKGSLLAEKQGMLLAQHFFRSLILPENSWAE